MKEKREEERNNRAIPIRGLGIRPEKEEEEIEDYDGIEGRELGSGSEQHRKGDKKKIREDKKEMLACQGEEEYLRGYHKEIYERLSLTVDILIFSLDREFRLQVLLKKREDFPYKGRRSLPGGFVGMEESVEEAAIRIMEQKTGFCNLHLEQLYTFGAKDRDPRMRIVTVAYLAVLPRELMLEGEVDSDFFRVRLSEKGLEFSGSEDFDEENLAFDHAKIIALAIERMRGKLHYTDISLEFLKDRRRFTLFELQRVYEAIEDRDYDTPNFRRYFKNRYETIGAVEKTGEVSTEFSKRPSSCYRMKTD